jgi:hypothetical protein
MIFVNLVAVDQRVILEVMLHISGLSNVLKL